MVSYVTAIGGKLVEKYKPGAASVSSKSNITIIQRNAVPIDAEKLARMIVKKLFEEVVNPSQTWASLPGGSGGERDGK